MQDFSRRLFLQSFTSSALLFHFSSCSLPHQLKFDFLNRHNDGSLEKLVKDKTILEKSIPLPYRGQKLLDHSEKALAEHYLQERVIAETETKSGAKIVGFRIDDISFTSYRVVPESIRNYATDYEEYCRYAINFLYSRKELKGLPQPIITWQQPTLQPTGTIPAFVGHSYLVDYKFSIKFQLETGKEVILEMSVPKPEGGGRIIGQSWYIDRREQKIIPTESHYAILVSTCADRALQVPFSEVTCILFREGLQKYIQLHEKQQERGDYFSYAKSILSDVEKLRETITESVSLYIMMQMIHQPSMRGVLAYTSENELENKGLGLAKVKTHGELYRDVPKAYAYIKRFGLEHTVNLFIDNPTQYVMEIN